MVRNNAFLFRQYDLIFLFEATYYAVNGIIKVAHVHFALAFTGSYKGGFITDIGYISSCKTRCLQCQFLNIKVFRFFDRLQMHVKYLFPSLYIGYVNRYLAVETARTKQGGIQ